LGCDADLVEVAGLAHDLGHPPFGHNGEEELNRLADSIGGFEGNAQTLRVVSRLEAKVFTESDESAGLNLTRGSLDASCKYPWARTPGNPKFGYYEDDAEVFAWLREGAPGTQTCLEEQVMDWSDDVAYSVHDFEDAVHSGLVSILEFGDKNVTDELCLIAQQRYSPEISLQQLQEAVARLRNLDYFPSSFDGSMRSMVMLKKFTSHLIGRFSVSAQIATQQQFGDQRLTRYDATLIVPQEVRDEVSVMKSVAVKWVMNRPGADRAYARQREIIAELVHALVLDAGRNLERWLKPTFEEATTDAQRFRVVIDQVASLTDVSIEQWHTQFCR
jgi:dGTPase